MSADRRWALILGASSGFGEAAARAYVAEGYDVIGVHLDRRGAMPRVDALLAELRASGRSVHFFNENAADDEARRSMIARVAEILGDEGGKIAILLHSLAFGTLKAFVPRDGKGVTRKQMDMTLDVMAHSLVYWVQDVVGADLFGANGRVFTLTSSGSHLALPEYGPVSAAKSALESHVRQLCMELAPRGITVNALMPGVTITPALEKIPGAETIIARARLKNPHGRLTTPADVAACLVALSRPETFWMNGNVIRVDGGEDFCA